MPYRSAPGQSGGQSPSPGQALGRVKWSGGPQLLPFSSGMVHFLTKAFDIRQAAPLGCGQNIPLLSGGHCVRIRVRRAVSGPGHATPTGASTPPGHDHKAPGGDWALCRAEARQARETDFYRGSDVRSEGFRRAVYDAGPLKATPGQTPRCAGPTSSSSAHPCWPAVRNLCLCLFTGGS